jgi:CubicO group peptidase (beta-lactamase class C family)
MKKTVAILFTLVVFSSFAQTKQDITLQIEKLFLRYHPQNPGCQLTITKNGTLLFSKAWGSADLEHNIPLTTTSIIEAGSVSKQFTAAAILLLEQQGKLSLENDVRKYIPELPDYGTIIKLKHLVHQTSGIKDWEAIADLAGLETGTKIYNNEDALEIILRQKTLNNIPGTEYLYSNSNYMLQGIVVKRVSGMSLADFSQKYIFIPAGMTHSQWRDNFRSIVPNRSIAYRKKDGAYESDMPFQDAYGDGGILTTTEDLLKWNDFYLSGKFGNPALKEKQIATDKLNNGLTNYYGAGLFIQTNRGLKVIRHTGATGSYRSYLGYYPQLDLAIAWLSNTSEFDDDDIADEIVKIFVDTPSLTVSEKKDASISVSPEILKIYEGWYRSGRTAYGTQIILKNDQLLAINRDSETTLMPVGEALFKMGDDLLLFDKKSKTFQWITPDNDIINYTIVAPANPELAIYAGSYFSDETKSEITILQKEETLMMVFNSYTAYPLKPTYIDAYRIMDFGGIINFERDLNNKVIKMKVGQGRARNVEFIKIK